jgi:hypothetical protein
MIEAIMMRIHMKIMILINKEIVTTNTRCATTNRKEEMDIGQVTNPRTMFLQAMF